MYFFYYNILELGFSGIFKAMPGAVRCYGSFTPVKMCFMDIFRVYVQRNLRERPPNPSDEPTEVPREPENSIKSMETPKLVDSRSRDISRKCHILAEFSGSRSTSVGSSEGFGGISRKFLCTYTLKVSITHFYRRKRSATPHGAGNI